MTVQLQQVGVQYWFRVLLRYFSVYRPCGSVYINHTAG